MGRRQRREVNECLAAISESEPRLILATGSYIGEGFDNARLDTLFLAIPISSLGFTGFRIVRRVVEVYDYIVAGGKPTLICHQILSHSQRQLDL